MAIDVKIGLQCYVYAGKDYQSTDWRKVLFEKMWTLYDKCSVLATKTETPVTGTPVVVVPPVTTKKPLLTLIDEYPLPVTRKPIPGKPTPVPYYLPMSDDLQPLPVLELLELEYPNPRKPLREPELLDVPVRALPRLAV